MPWWGWVVFGAFLLGSELLVVDAGFYLVFIGIAAAITGLVGLAGLELVDWGQWILFSVLSLVLMVFFRKKIYARIRANQQDYPDGPTGESLLIEETLAPGAQCRVSFRGTSWNVVNEGKEAVEKGSRVAVDAVDGLTLKINQTKT